MFYMERFIAPAKLPTKCHYNFGDVDVIAVGNGQKSKDSYGSGDLLMRHIYLKTMSFDDSLDGLEDFSEPHTVICTEPISDRSIFYGDSGIYMSKTNFIIFCNISSQYSIDILANMIFSAGGPLLRQSDGTLIGITSALRFNAYATTLNVFTKIQSMYDWISATTGLDLPLCPF